MRSTVTSILVLEILSTQGVSGCPDSVDLAISVGQAPLFAAFSRHGSLIGTCLAFVHLHNLNAGGGCRYGDRLCIAASLESAAHALFVEQGCADVVLRKGFENGLVDILQASRFASFVDRSTCPPHLPIFI